MFKILNPIKTLGRYLIRQFDDGATESTNELLRSLVASQAEVVASQAELVASQEEVVASLAELKRMHETLVHAHTEDHKLLQTAVASLAESKQMVQSLSMIALSLLDTEINFDSVLAESQSNSRSDFKKRLHSAHGLPSGSAAQSREFIATGIISDVPENIRPTEFLSYDQATGKVLPSSIVIAAHIYPHRWKIHLLTSFPPSVTNDPSNGLMLLRSVERAFDRAQVCIDVQCAEGQDFFTFRLLDKSLRNTKLTEGVSVQGLSFETTFGDLDGQSLHWPPGSHFRPSRRLLALHAAIAVHKAQNLYEYQENGPFPYHLSGDIKALAGIEAFSTLREFAWNTDNHN